MRPFQDEAKHTLQFYSGWRLALHRSYSLLATGRYFLQRNRYPLFSYSPKHGLPRTLKIGHEIGLRKIPRLDGAYFPALTMPHYPSRAYDRMVANGGLNCAAAGTAMKQQIDTAILAVTRRCDLHCQHCYERFNIGAKDSVPVERWKEVVRDLQRIGTNVIVLSGGEPMLRYPALLELLEGANKNLSDFHLHTSGHGVTLERALELRRAGLMAAAVGLDDVVPERHDDLRGHPGSFSEAVNALKVFHEAGVFTYVNVCATRELVRSGDLWRYFELVKSLNVGFIQLLEPRPCGGYFADGEDALLTQEDRRAVMKFFVEGNSKKRFRDYPIIYYVAFTESPAQMGCMMGGLSHFTIDSMGNVNPCVFLPVTFGNVMEEDFTTIYERMRKAVPRPLHTECPSLSLSATLKDRKHKGQRVPIHYDSVRSEWETMYRVSKN
ncbi:MAG TPA: hypothetical protein DGH68_07595 [Bacteroidetes bacterium]|jgi:MoaA/NifB/PqqE/SkfB family radical SAM enzyme|nr:hypothetical protein [Bacteroidota bacterium]